MGAFTLALLLMALDRAACGSRGLSSLYELEKLKGSIRDLKAKVGTVLHKDDDVALANEYLDKLSALTGRALGKALYLAKHDKHSALAGADEIGTASDADLSVMVEEERQSVERVPVAAGTGDIIEESTTGRESRRLLDDPGSGEPSSPPFPPPPSPPPPTTPPPPSRPPTPGYMVQASFTIEGDVSEFDVSAFQERLSVLLGAPVFAEDISVQPASIKVEVTIGMPDAASALHAAETLNDAEDLSTSLGVTVLGAHADAEAASPMPPPPTPPRAPYDDKLGAATIAAIVVPVALVLLVLGGLVGWVMLARPQSDAVYREHLQDVEMRGGGYTTGRNAALSASACNHPRDQTGNAPSQHVALAKTDSAVSGAI